MSITDAFVSADLLADALHKGLTGRVPLDQALFDYQHQRDAATAEGYALTLATARLAPLSTRLEDFFRRASNDPGLVEEIFGVLGGSLRARDVFPQHPARSAALLDHPQ